MTLVSQENRPPVTLKMNTKHEGDNTTMSLSDAAPDKGKNSLISARSIAIMAIFIALSAAASFIKIPSPTGTVALDAAPGFFAAIAFGPVIGFIVIAVGHILTSAMVGFPFTLPIHLVIAAGMGICALAYWYFARKIGKKSLVWLIVGAVVAALLNAFGVSLVVLPMGGWGMYMAVWPSLLVAGSINVVIAGIAFFAVRNSKLLD